MNGHLFFIALISFLGSLQLGVLNMVAFKYATSKQIRHGIMVGFGVSVAEIPYAILAFWLAGTSSVQNLSIE